MYHYYAILAFWILFGAPAYYWGVRSNRSYEQLQENTIVNVKDLHGRMSNAVATQGDHCTLFESKAQELCSHQSKNDKLRLSMLMANCHLETVNAPPLPFDTVDGMEYASDAEKVIALQMLSRLPIFCSSLATLGMQLGFMSQGRTYSMMNETVTKLDEITRIAEGFERDNIEGIKVQKELINISAEALNNSLYLSSMAKDMRKSMGNFTAGIEQVLATIHGLRRSVNGIESDEKKSIVLIKQYSDEARQMWGQTHTFFKAEMGPNSRDGKLSIELMKHQVLIILIFILFIVSRTGLPAYSFAAFILVIVLFLLGLAVFFSRFISKANIIPFTKFMFRIMFQNAMKNTNEVLLGALIIVLVAIFFAYRQPKRETIRSHLAGSSVISRIPVPGFDIHNTNEVIDFLKRQDRDLDEIVRRLKYAIGICSRQSVTSFSEIGFRPSHSAQTKAERKDKKRSIAKISNQKWTHTVETGSSILANKNKKNVQDTSKPVKIIMKNVNGIELERAGRKETFTSIKKDVIKDLTNSVLDALKDDQRKGTKKTEMEVKELSKSMKPPAVKGGKNMIFDPIVIHHHNDSHSTNVSDFDKTTYSDDSLETNTTVSTDITPFDSYESRGNQRSNRYSSADKKEVKLQETSSCSRSASQKYTSRSSGSKEESDCVCKDCLREAKTSKRRTDGKSATSTDVTSFDGSHTGTTDTKSTWTEDEHWRSPLKSKKVSDVTKKRVRKRDRK